MLLAVTDYISEQFSCSGHHLAERKPAENKEYIELYENGGKHWGWPQSCIIGFRRSRVEMTKLRLVILLIDMLKHTNSNII